MFNEWKESDDYKIQQWFIKKKTEVENWFNENILTDFEFEYFDFSTIDTYDVFSASIHFNDSTIKWTLNILIDPEEIEDNIVENITLILKGYSNESEEMIGMIEEKINEKEFNIDYIITIIDKFKTEYNIL